jgi:hypothetical protein
VSETDAAAHFSLWLRAGMTGCDFAKRLAGRANRLAIALHVEAELPSTRWIDDTFDANADADRAVITVFPRISSEQGLVDFLNALARERWRIRRRARTSPSGGVLVGVDWTTKNGDVSETMGFAPFPSMPVPRRAPYVAIATWPGRRANPFRGTRLTPASRDGVVSFLDAPHDLDAAEYERRWAETSARVTSLMSVPPDNAALYRRSAFVISAEAAATLSFDA